MKIYIKIKSRKKIPIPIPIPLSLIKMILSLSTGKLARKHIPENKKIYWDCINWQQLKDSVDLLKDYKGLKIVEVKASDGTEITIVV